LAPGHEIGENPLPLRVGLLHADDLQIRVRQGDAVLVGVGANGVAVTEILRGHVVHGGRIAPAKRGQVPCVADLVFLRRDGRDRRGKENDQKRNGNGLDGPPPEQSMKTLKHKHRPDSKEKKEARALREPPVRSSLRVFPEA